MPETCAAPRLYVPAPTVVPPRYGLFSVSIIVDEPNAHWQNGVEWEPVACPAAGTTECECIGESPGVPDKTYREGTPLIEVAPFSVYGSFECSPIGRWEDGQQRALSHLLAGEQRAVERAIATGESGAEPNFTQAVDITPTAPLVTVWEGVSLLEQYLGENYHSIGVIHMSRREATYAKHDDVICCPGNSEQLRTSLGTLIAAGGGYDGQSGPSEPGPDQAWIYATGRPQIRRSEPFFVPEDRRNALDTEFNNLRFLAERTYTVGWDCLTAAVLVNVETGES